jgi:hypothetical protein
MNSRYVICSITSMRVADAAGPEGVPDAVDLALEVSGDHTSQGIHGAVSAPEKAGLPPTTVASPTG